MRIKFLEAGRNVGAEFLHLLKKMTMSNGEVNQPEKVAMKRKLSSAISLLTKATTKMRTSKCLEEEMKTVVNQNTVQNNNHTCMKVQYYTQS